MIPICNIYMIDVLWYDIINFICIYKYIIIEADLRKSLWLYWHYFFWFSVYPILLTSSEILLITNESTGYQSTISTLKHIQFTQENICIYNCSTHDHELYQNQLSQLFVFSVCYIIIVYFVLYCEDKHQVLENASGKSI